MHHSYLGLGSNLNHPAEQIKKAIEMISHIDEINLVRQSKGYKNPALIHPDSPNEVQPDYINAVIFIKTSLQPLELLHVCQRIETQMGRVRSSKRWEARIIDIDILLFDTLVLMSEELIIPHPEIKNRRFMIEPLYEINPSLEFPDGTKLQDIFNAFRTGC